MNWNSVLNFIQGADDTELNQMLDAIAERYKIVHPDYDIIFLSLPHGDPQARKRLLTFALKYDIDPQTDKIPE